MSQISQLISITYKEFFRNPGIIFWSFIFPILMAWGLGIAFTKQDELIRSVAWIKSESTPTNIAAYFSDRNMITAGSDKTGKVRYQILEASYEEAITMLKKGRVSIIIDESKNELEYHFDPANPEAQLSYLHLSRILSGNNEFESSEHSVEPLTRKGTRYVDFLVPGLIAMNIMMSCMWGISYTMIDKRIKKLLRRMVATPMKKSSFMTAQFVARLGLSALDVVIIYGFTYLYFNISIQGSIVALTLMFLAGNLAFTGIAILVSSRTSNAQVGNGLINAVVMPMMILSGIFFSYHNFPDWAINVIQWMPLTMLADSVRSIFNEGAMIVDVLPSFVFLCVLGFVFFGIGIRVYKWY